MYFPHKQEGQLCQQVLASGLCGPGQMKAALSLEQLTATERENHICEGMCLIFGGWKGKTGGGLRMREPWASRAHVTCKFRPTRHYQPKDALFAL
jgi:hypothetical protein